MPKRKPKEYTDQELIVLMQKSGISSSRSVYFEDHWASVQEKLKGVDSVVRTPTPILKHLFGGPVSAYAKEFLSGLPEGVHLVFDSHLPTKFSAMIIICGATVSPRLMNPTVSLEVRDRIFNIIPYTAFIEDEEVTYE